MVKEQDYEPYVGRWRGFSGRRFGILVYVALWALN